MVEKLDYEHEKDRVLGFLENKHAIVLATSLEGRVTARTVSFANDGLAILFMSWGHHTKCAQIRGNPRVALCRDNVQMEGVAEILGSPLDERNQRYADILREKYPENHALFAHDPGMVIVRVLPTSITVFGKSDDQFCLKCLDAESETIYLRLMTE
jgi:general stress protein 26